ncbi:MAG: DNA starvation/stationary phase protection protein [Rickettsiales bacterium]|nr:DNA starvation/stationary phase protection protein [Rickettsiales bacterium]
MKNHKTLENLEKTLATSYALALKTQNYHWNVVGGNFKSLHELFGAQYEELFDAIDEIAERIRALGSKVDGSFENFSKVSMIKSGNKNYDSNEMLKDLVVSHEDLIDFMKKSIKIAQDEGDEATADMFIGRVEAHDKAAWMLRSSLS